MLISELSKRTGLSKDTIRFYEKIGLIQARDRQAGTRLYKEFDEETMAQLLMIHQGKQLGFTLNEIKQLMDAWSGGTLPASEQMRVIQGKLQEISEKMRQLSEIHAYLTEKLARLQGDGRAIAPVSGTTSPNSEANGKI